MLLPAPAVGKHTGTKHKHKHKHKHNNCNHSGNGNTADMAHKGRMHGPIYHTWDCSRCGRLLDAADVETGEQGAMIYCRACGGWTALTSAPIQRCARAANGRHGALRKPQTEE